MQKYGAPPSYPNLKIPGLNAPLPEDNAYNMYYDKMDNKGKAFLTDFFKKKANPYHSEKIDKSLWGEPIEAEDEDEEEE